MIILTYLVGYIFVLWTDLLGIWNAKLAYKMSISRTSYNKNLICEMGTAGTTHRTSAFIDSMIVYKNRYWLYCLVQTVKSFCIIILVYVIEWNCWVTICHDDCQLNSPFFPTKRGKLKPGGKS